MLTAPFLLQAVAPAETAPDIQLDINASPTPQQQQPQPQQ